MQCIDANLLGAGVHAFISTLVQQHLNISVYAYNSHEASVCEALAALKNLNGRRYPPVLSQSVPAGVHPRCVSQPCCAEAAIPPRC